MITVAFDGPDGAGKTTCLSVVADHLVSKGLFVHVCAPFRTVEVYPLWKTDPVSAARRIRQVIDANLEVATKDARDVVLFDRHWPTAAVSTPNWQAVDLIRQSGIDRLFLLVPPKPKEVAEKEAWTPDGVDQHWIAYRCLAEGAPAIQCPRADGHGNFSLTHIKQEIASFCGV